MTQQDIIIPEIPDDDIHPKKPDFRWLWKVILLISWFWIFTYIFLIFFSFLITLEITLEEEKEIFPYYEASQTAHYIPNWEVISDYPIEIPKNIEVYLIESPEINAYARIWWYVIFTTGIMDNFSNQEEFLYVLWHEITHVQERHAIRSLAFSSPLKLMMSYIGLGSWVDLEELLQVWDLYMSRKDELSADLWWVKFVQKYWWNPKCASVFFSSEATQSWSTFWKYLSTHPEHEERINFLEKYDTKEPCKEIPY
jgi:hypothetical protein